LDALIGHFGLFRNAKEIHDDASGVESQRLFNWLLNHATKQCARKLCAVNVGDIGAQNERGFFFSGQRLQTMRLADSELDCVRRSFDECANGSFKIFNPLEKTAFVKKSVIDGDIKTAIGLGVKETVQSVKFHKFAT
jgi:hypothetical protein